jgi:hypothetical protein
MPEANIPEYSKEERHRNRPTRKSIENRRISSIHIDPVTLPCTSAYRALPF